MDFSHIWQAVTKPLKAYGAITIWNVISDKVLEPIDDMIPIPNFVISINDSVKLLLWDMFKN